MAQRVITTTETIDDINGNLAAETVRFEFEGIAYEIDLDANNVEAFRSEMGEWIENARRVRRVAARKRTSSKPKTKAAAKKTERPTDNATVRAWARDNGIEISSVGRIPRRVMDSYLSMG